MQHPLLCLMKAPQLSIKSNQKNKTKNEMLGADCVPSTSPPTPTLPQKSKKVTLWCPFGL